MLDHGSGFHVTQINSVIVPVQLLLFGARSIKQNCRGKQIKLKIARDAIGRQMF